MYVTIPLVLFSRSESSPKSLPFQIIHQDRPFSPLFQKPSALSVIFFPNHPQNPSFFFCLITFVFLFKRPVKTLAFPFPSKKKMAFYSVFMDAIPAYTGLSPAAFFTILALMVGIYRLVCGMFVSPEDFKEKTFAPSESFHVAEPVQLGDVTAEELRAYDGLDPKKPLLMAIKGQIYDVSRSRMFYGPGGPYALFAGRDASRALALLSFEPKDLTGNIEGLSPSELETLRDWELKFVEKYVKVGQLVTEKVRCEDTVGGEKAQDTEELKEETQNLIKDTLYNEVSDTVGKT